MEGDVGLGGCICSWFQAAIFFLFLYHMKNQSLPLPMLPKITAQKALTIPIVCLLHQEYENLSKIWAKVTNREAVFASLEPGAEIIDFGDKE